MELPDDALDTFFKAGAAALRFNAPMSLERADSLVGHLARAGCRSVVDLGCGRGELARLVAAALPEASVVGVDTNPCAIDTARKRTVGSGGSGRIAFEVADATTRSGPVDAAICIGVSQVFGGPAEMFLHLADLVPEGVAVIGDGLWETTPTRWCLDTLGEHPAGLDGLVDLAEAGGWAVIDSGLSTPAEWDAFEQGWVDGVRSIGSEEALAFAAEREADYLRRYRGVLGFGWLVLRR